MKLHYNDAGHMTMMATMPIYFIFFPGTSELAYFEETSTKLCKKHQRPKLIIFCANDSPGLILTYLTGRSNFAT